MYSRKLEMYPFLWGGGEEERRGGGEEKRKRGRDVGRGIEREDESW